MRFREFNPVLTESRILSESRGLGGRTPGDRFVSTDGDEDMEFIDINFFPPGGGKYDAEEFAPALEEIEQEYGVVHWVNTQSSKTGGFGIAEFQTANGDLWTYGRFFQKIAPLKANNSWDNKGVNGGIPGYNYDSKVSRKENAGLQPSDLLTSLEDLTPQNIIEQVQAKFGAEHTLTRFTKAIEAGVQLPIKLPAPADFEIDSFSNYFCEILHPIALQRGVFSGEAGEAAKLFLGTPSFDGTTITFGSNKTEGLSDSTLVSPNGTTIRVSSKAAAGASASVGNLSNSIEEIQLAGDTRLIKSLKDTIEITDLVQQYSSKEAPVQLALKFNIINTKEAHQIKNLENLAADGKVTYSSVLADSSELFTARLTKLYNNKATTKPNEADAFAHMLTCIMYKTADHINSKTSFGVDSAKILANAALVQVHTIAKVVGDQWELTDFKTKYPGNFNITVALDPTKHYMSTKIKGKVTFKILAAGEKTRTYYVDSSSKANKKAAADSAPPKKITARTG